MKDVILGLLLGNFMAVLSWALVCAPIAVQTRLTLYWYLRRIAGPVVTAVYNVLNGVLYCILAGAMITVAASAVRIPFGIPPQTGWLPHDWRFVAVVLGVGAVVVTVAILGFKRLAQFSLVSSPWLLTMFASGALATLPTLAMSVLKTGELHGLSDFWRLAQASIWTGKSLTGAKPIGFWHVAAFAWICNLAMHIGLSDMALLRYARRWTYGFYSAFGMFLGHYLAWVAAGIMGASTALALRRPLIELDAGAVAHYSLGVAGAIAVVVAGWTTANPTLYRAGLAFQAITPNWPRWLVTLLAGTITTLIACSPFVFTELLNFVGIYGLLLMPVGAVVFVEHWLFPKLGLSRGWASRKGLALNWSALTSWAISVAIALALWLGGILHLFFLFIPTWVLTASLYLFLSRLAGAGEVPPEAEPSPAKVARTEGAPPSRPARKRNPLIAGMLLSLAVLSLLACLALSIWVFLSGGEGYERALELFKAWLPLPTALYFASGIGWAWYTERGLGP